MTTKFTVEISEAEMAVRLAEAILGLGRPPGKSAKEAVDSMPEGARENFLNGARAAMLYLQECVDNGTEVS
jgi:hypothetical protein